MPDPSWTDATRNAIFDRLGCIAAFQRDFLLLARLFSEDNTEKYWVRMISGDEAKAAIEDIRITRAVITRQGTSSGGDTDVNGVVYATLTDGGGGTGHTISFYKDQARTSKVADLDSATDDDNTGLISPDSGFTLDGEIDIGTSTGSNINFAFEIIPNPLDRIGDEFDGTQLEDAAIEAQLKTAFAQARADLLRAASRFEGPAGSMLRTMIVRLLGFADSDVIHNAGQSVNSTGGIVSQPSGLIQILKQAMEDNTGGSGEVKVQAISGSPTFTSPGTWSGRSDGLTTDDRLVPGVILGTCTKGLDSTAPKFRLKLTPTDARNEAGADYDQIYAEFELTLGQTFRSQRLGIASFVLNYAPTVSNESGTPLNTTGTNWSVTGLSTANSTSGQVWVHHDGTDINFYKTEAGRDAQDSSDVVASVTSPGTASTFTATGSAGLTISGTTGATAASGNTGNVDFNPPVATDPPGYFLLTTTAPLTTNPAIMQRLVQRGLFAGASWHLNSGSSPNVVDSQVYAGSLALGFKGMGDRV